MKRSRHRFTLLLSLLLATTAAVAVYLVLASQESPNSSAASAPPTPTSVPTVAVVVAKQDIPADTVLTEAMLEAKQISAGAKQADAVTDVSQAVGKVNAGALTQGEQLLSIRLADAPRAQTGTFSGEVPVGMRAISVPFDEVIGSGALVQPGDHVDVLAFFELNVKDLSLKGSGANVGDQSGSTSDNSDTNQNDYDYKQYVTTYVVQNVEVLAVSQALTADDLGVGDGGAAQPTPTPVASSTAANGDDETTPVARPSAKSVTLAVTPEQAQRLLLASQTVTQPHAPEKGFVGSLRLVLRAPGDTTTVDVGPAKLGDIPLGGLLGDVDKPMLPSDLVIVDATFKERILSSGGVLEFSATVKNVSDHTIKSGKDAPPEYVYTQGIAYDALGFFPDKGTYRIGLNVAGAYPTQFPYRWGLGRDLKPGESIVVNGSVQLTDPTPDTRYWLGIIQEPNAVTQDGVNVSDITVMQATAGTVDTETALMRAEPDDSSAVVLQLLRNDPVTIEQVHGVWFKVRFGDKEGWLRVDALDVPPLDG